MDLAKSGNVDKKTMNKVNREYQFIIPKKYATDDDNLLIFLNDKIRRSIK